MFAKDIGNKVLEKMEENEDIKKVLPMFPIAEEPKETSDSSKGCFGLTDKQARFCYAMSKQTIVLEKEDGPTKYDKLLFVEFLELIGRIAQIKYDGTEIQNEPFVKRLEYVLEITFSLIGQEVEYPEKT